MLHISASRRANSRRSVLGASSRNQLVCRRPGRSTALRAMVDLNYCGRPQPHDPWRWAFEADAHRESLRHAHPVERALDIRSRAGQIDLILIEHAPADAVDNSPYRQAAIDHRIRRYAVAGVHRGEIRLAEIGGDEPFLGIDEGEQRLPRSDELAAGDVEPNYQAVVLRAYSRIP